jgi:putative PIN family toxin of toxin-antitoxin system
VKAVIDTNVLVSGLMKKGTPPGAVIADLYAGELVALYDPRILAEYRAVFARPELRILPAEAATLLAHIDTKGLLAPGATMATQLPDRDDQPFLEVAFAGGADVLITGNLRHFPVGDLIRVVTPRQWLDLKATLPR